MLVTVNFATDYLVSYLLPSLDVNRFIYTGIFKNVLSSKDQWRHHGTLVSVNFIIGQNMVDEQLFLYYLNEFLMCRMCQIRVFFLSLRSNLI